MGSMSVMHWILVIGAMILLFGGNRIAGTMGEIGRGLRVFRNEVADGDKTSLLEGGAER